MKFQRYFAKNQPKSVLCLPIQQMGTLKGVLFLESMTSNKIFSAQRLKVIDFLCSQVRSSFFLFSSLSFLRFFRKVLLLSSSFFNLFSFVSFFFPSSSPPFLSVRQRYYFLLFLYPVALPLHPSLTSSANLFDKQIGISLENALLYSKVTSSEAQYQILADTIPQYVFVAHPDGDVYFAVSFISFIIQFLALIS
jgi:hypothetical protein